MRPTHARYGMKFDLMSCHRAGVGAGVWAGGRRKLIDGRGETVEKGWNGRARREDRDHGEELPDGIA